MSSSLTIFTTCCAGLSAPETSAPRARSFTAAMNSRTTGRATSASSRASRISRAVASMSASESRPLPRRLLKTDSSRSDRVSNMSPPAYGPRLPADLSAAHAVRAPSGADKSVLCGLDLDAAAGVHLLDLLGVRRQHPAPLQLHRRRQQLGVGHPLLAEQQEATD